MTLDELLKVNKEEFEVFDSEIDAYCSYIADGDSLCYGENEDEKGLEKTEKWLRGLEVVGVRNGTAFVNAYEPIRKNWEKFRKKLIKLGYLYEDLENIEDKRLNRIYDEEATVYVSDIYTILSQGYYKRAEDFAELLNL